MASTIEATTAGTVVANKAQPRQLRTTFPEVIEATVTLTEASLAAGVLSQVSVTVTGAAVGDFVLVSGAFGAGSHVWGYVSAANTVVVRILNLETADANTTWSAGIAVNILVLKRRTGFAQN